MKLLICTNTVDFFLSHRLLLAKEAKAAGFNVALLAPDSPKKTKVLEAGFEFFPLNISRKGKNPLLELLLLIKFYKAIKTIQPDVYHGFTIKPVLYGALACKIIGIKKVVLSITGLGSLYLDKSFVSKLLSQFILQIYRFTIKQKNFVAVFQNKDDMQIFLKKSLVGKAQARLIPGTGVDCNRFSPSKHEEAPTRLIFPARFLKHKGINELIRACDILSLEGISFKLLLCGDIDAGNPSSITESELDSIMKKTYLERAEQISDMTEVLKGDRIVVLPSYREGLSLSLLEACASGLPIVTSDVPGCRDAVRNGKNGFLTSKADPKSLAIALKELIQDKALREKFGIQSRLMAEELFDKNKVLPNFIKIYKEQA